MTNRLTRRFGAAIGAAGVACALSLGGASIADAKIEEEPVSCTNQGGKLPAGQQPECKGSAHEQESEFRNPAGHAPGGHNK